MPRMVRLGSFGVCLWTSGCLVPQQKYDQAVEQISAERTAREDLLARLQASEQQLARATEELAQARARLDSQEALLTEREGAMASSGFEIQQLVTERDDHAQRVEQLRGELARVGDHLRVYSEQKATLQTALDAAEARIRDAQGGEASAAQRTLLARDVTYALHDVVESDHAVVRPHGTRLLVRFPASRMVGRSSGLTLAATQILHRLAAAVGPFHHARLELSGAAADGDVTRSEATLRAMADALVEAGVPRSSIVISVPAEGGSPATDGAEAPAADAARSAWREGTGSVDVIIDPSPAPPKSDPESPSSALQPADGVERRSSDRFDEEELGPVPAPGES